MTAYAASGSKPYTLQKTAPNGGAAEVLVAASQTSPRRTPQGFTVKALAANTGTVYLGASGVTSSTGYPLAAGESVYVPFDDPSRVYCVGSAASQVVAVLGGS